MDDLCAEVPVQHVPKPVPDEGHRPPYRQHRPNRGGQQQLFHPPAKQHGDDLFPICFVGLPGGNAGDPHRFRIPQREGIQAGEQDLPVPPEPDDRLACAGIDADLQHVPPLDERVIKDIRFLFAEADPIQRDMQPSGSLMLDPVPHLPGSDQSPCPREQQSSSQQALFFFSR